MRLRLDHLSATKKAGNSHPIGRNEPIREFVQQAIQKRLNSGSVSCRLVAIDLGVSRRTLRRRLARENTTYQELLNTSRMRNAANQLLTRSNLSIAELAEKLGYSKHCVFTRAFSNWHGVPPSEYRRTHDSRHPYCGATAKAGASE